MLRDHLNLQKDAELINRLHQKALDGTKGQRAAYADSLGNLQLLVHDLKKQYDNDAVNAGIDALATPSQKKREHLNLQTDAALIKRLRKEALNGTEAQCTAYAESLGALYLLVHDLKKKCGDEAVNACIDALTTHSKNAKSKIPEKDFLSLQKASGTVKRRGKKLFSALIDHMGLSEEHQLNRDILQTDVPEGCIGLQGIAADIIKDIAFDTHNIAVLVSKDKASKAR